MKISRGIRFADEVNRRAVAQVNLPSRARASFITGSFTRLLSQFETRLSAGSICGF